LLCQPCFRLRVKRTEETGGGESQIKNCTRGTAQHNRGHKRKNTISHFGALRNHQIMESNLSRLEATIVNLSSPDKSFIYNALQRTSLLAEPLSKQSARLLLAVVLT